MWSGLRVTRRVKKERWGVGSFVILCEMTKRERTREGRRGGEG